MKKIIASTNSKLLSVFWYINGEFVGPEASLNSEEVVNYGVNLQLDRDHFFEWSKYSPAPNIEYDDYPRGRVLFNTEIHKFIVIGDKKICNNNEVKEALLEYYGLPSTTIFKTDEHYTSRL